MATWHTRESAREQWDDAPSNDGVLDLLLELSRDAVLAYAGVTAGGVDGSGVHTTGGYVSPDDPGTIKAAWRVAQLRHMRNVYASEYPAGSALSDLDAVDTFSTPARFRDLDASIRELIRPRVLFGGPVG